MDVSNKQFYWGQFPNEEETFWLHDTTTTRNPKLTEEEIDILRDHPSLDTIRISNLRQDTFEYLIRTYGTQFKNIIISHSQLVEDWSLLGTLPGLEYLYFHWNQRITRLWDLSGNPNLKGLFLSNFTRLHSIEGIEKGRSLRQLFIGDAVWTTWVIDSLMPLSGMNLKYLVFCGGKILDNDLSFLPTLEQLEAFDCPINLFTTEQCAWAVANCPRVTGRIMQAKEDWQASDHHESLAAIVGKRKPTLSMEKDEKRIQKYVDHFETLKKRYEGVPYWNAFPELKSDGKR